MFLHISQFLVAGLYPQVILVIDNLRFLGQETRFSMLLLETICKHKNRNVPLKVDQVLSGSHRSGAKEPPGSKTCLSHHIAMTGSRLHVVDTRHSQPGCLASNSLVKGRDWRTWESVMGICLVVREGHPVLTNMSERQLG